jgi:hypothetical protein
VKGLVCPGLAPEVGSADEWQAFADWQAPPLTEDTLSWAQCPGSAGNMLFPDTGVWQGKDAAESAAAQAAPWGSAVARGPGTLLRAGGALPPGGAGVPTPTATPTPAPVVGHHGRRSEPRELPAAALKILRLWLSQHLDRPYATAAERDSLAAEAGLDPHQVAVWFNNTRKRVLMPLLQAAELVKCSGSFPAPAVTPAASVPSHPMVPPAAASASKRRGGALEAVVRARIATLDALARTRRRLEAELADVEAKQRLVALLVGRPGATV